MSLDRSDPLRDHPLRLGVIGCGRIAQVAHLPALAKAETITLAGVSDRSPSLAKGVGARYGVPGFTEVSELLAEDIEAVLIAVPDRFHLPVGTEALTAGKHVLMEKPAASTSQQATELARLAADRGLKLQIGAMRRHDPGINYARRAVAEIGPILSVSCWYRVHARLRPPTEATLFPYTVVDEDVRKHEAEFKADRQRYLLATHGAHVFDTLRYLAGDLAAVQARVAHVGADFSWHGSGQLAGGGLASFEIWPTCTRTTPRASRSTANAGTSASGPGSRSSAGPARCGCSPRTTPPGDHRSTGRPTPTSGRPKRSRPRSAPAAPPTRRPRTACRPCG